MFGDIVTRSVKLERFHTIVHSQRSSVRRYFEISIVKSKKILIKWTTDHLPYHGTCQQALWPRDRTANLENRDNEKLFKKRSRIDIPENLQVGS